MFELGRRSDEEEDPPSGRSMLGLSGIAPGSLAGRDAPPGPDPPLPAADVPRFDLDVERRSEGAFPVERAILFSLLAHIAILLLILLAPPARSYDPRKGLLGALIPPEPSPEEKIPIQFREAPGPARSNPRRSPFSDADRRAGGGDKSRPRSDTPFVPDRPGKTGLAPGAVARAAPPRARPGEQGERGGAGAAPVPGAQSKAQREQSSEGALLEPPSGGVTSPGKPGQPGPRLSDLDRAIQEAARGLGSGEQGAGIPNPDGGFADSGPLSFDTTWYDWGPYAAELVRRIKLHWDIPSLARLGWKGKVTIRFFILADGRVADARILSVSGVPPFDHAAFAAITTSSPFRPLPKDLLDQVPGKDREGIVVTFFYNLRPAQSGAGEGTR